MSDQVAASNLPTLEADDHDDEAALRAEDERLERSDFALMERRNDDQAQCDAEIIADEQLE